MDKNREITLIDNTLKILRKGKYELSGDEAVVFYSCFQYLVQKLNDLKKPDIVQQTEQPSLVVEPKKSKKK